MSLLLRKTKNFLRYIHPLHIQALCSGKTAFERKVIRQSLRPKPASFETRINLLREFADRFGCRILIETGTFKGDMIAAQLDYFEELHTIELAEHLYHDAVKRFSDHSKVHLHYGDSSQVLPKILSKIQEPCVFWLDGHASGGETARGTQLTPILNELDAILAHPIKTHAILIDDAREFGTGKGYPNLKQVQKKTEGTYSCFEVKEDIIRIYPRLNCPHL